MRIQLLVSALLLSLSIPVVADQESSQRLDQVREEIKTLNADLSQKKADKDALYQQLEQHSKKISQFARKLRELETNVSTKKQELNQLQQDLGIKKQEQEAQLSALYDQIKSAYLHAQPSYFKILLNQQNMSTISRSTTYYRYFHQARQQQLQEINQTLLTLNQQQEQVLASEKALEELYQQQQQQQIALQAESNKRESTLKALEQSISSQDARLTALKSEEQSLQDLLNSLAKKVTQAQPSKQNTASWKPTGPFSRLTGKLPWPVKGKILARYGTSRNLGKLKWQGIVIASPTGNEVHSSASGKVVFADWLRGFGLLIIIDHGEQYMSLYGNNETLLKETGDVVQAGELIAQSGEQGIRGLAGLYFEIRHKGNPTNPLKWLQRRG